MLNTSIAINKKFDSTLQKRIEAALGRKNIFDVVKYYYSFIEDLNYSIIFIRGKKIPSWEYINILTKSFKTKGIACTSDERSVLLDFYNSGESVFKIETTHPIELKLDGNLNINSEGEINNLNQFTNAFDYEKLDRIIHGVDNYFFFPRSYAVDILGTLGLYGLYPMLFWDYDTLVSAQKNYGDLDALVEMNEFTNLEQVQI